MFQDLEECSRWFCNLELCGVGQRILSLVLDMRLHISLSIWYKLLVLYF